MISPNLTSLEILALEELNQGIQPSADMAKCLCKEKLASAAYRSGTWVYTVTAEGKRYLERHAVQMQESAQRSRRYWITTAIALLALLKSFLPELRALWALLWK